MWIFGTGAAAECAAFELEWEFEGFCVDAIEGNHSRFGKPVMSYEQLQISCPGAEIFVAMGYRGLNLVRAGILHRVIADGFAPQSILGNHRGMASAGVNSFVMASSVIHPFVELGDNVFVWGGATICHHVEIGSHVWVTAGAVVAGNTKIGSNVFIGANATIASGLSLGNNVFVGAGSLVTDDLPDGSVVATKSSSPLNVDSETFVSFLDLKGNY